MEGEATNPALAAYQEGKILSMRPTDLIRRYYEIVLEEVSEARERLASGDAMGRSQSVSRAMAAVHELTASLDETKNPEYVTRARVAYRYILQQLLQAHLNKSDEIFAQVARIVTAILANWVESCRMLDEADHRRHHEIVEVGSGSSSGGWAA